MTATSERVSEHYRRPQQAARALLSDHLAAALDHCEALLSASVPLGASIATGADGSELLRQGRAVSTFVRDIRTRELAIGLRLTRASAVSATAATHDRTVRPLALLVRSGAAVLIDAAASAGRHLKVGEADTGDHAFLASRGLLSASAISLPIAGSLSVDDTFLVLGLTPLGDVSAFLRRALDALDMLG